MLPIIQSEGSSEVECFSFSTKKHLKWHMGIKTKDDFLACFNKIIICLPATNQKSQNIPMSCIGAGWFCSFTWQPGQSGSQKHMSETLGLALFLSRTSYIEQPKCSLDRIVIGKNFMYHFFFLTTTVICNWFLW